jgi:hypothetical protein
MSKLKNFLPLIIALFVMALASRAVTSNSVTLKISPTAVEFHAEGSQK